MVARRARTVAIECLGSKRAPKTAALRRLRGNGGGLRGGSASARFGRRLLRSEMRNMRTAVEAPSLVHGSGTRKKRPPPQSAQFTAKRQKKTRPKPRRSRFPEREERNSYCCATVARWAALAALAGAAGGRSPQPPPSALMSPTVEFMRLPASCTPIRSADSMLRSASITSR